MLKIFDNDELLLWKWQIIQNLKWKFKCNVVCSWKCDQMLKSKVAQFFQKLPKRQSKQPLRKMCVFQNIPPKSQQIFRLLLLKNVAKNFQNYPFWSHWLLEGKKEEMGYQNSARDWKMSRFLHILQLAKFSRDCDENSFWSIFSGYLFHSNIFVVIVVEFTPCYAKVFLKCLQTI